LQNVVDIMIAGDPSLNDFLVARIDSLHAQQYAAPPDATSPPLHMVLEQANTRRHVPLPSTVEEMTLGTANPTFDAKATQVDAAPELPAEGLTCLEDMGDSLSATYTTTTTTTSFAITDKNETPTHSTPTSSLSTSASVLPTPEAQPPLLQQEVSVSPGMTDSPVPSSAGASSLLFKSALPEAAYIPLSEVNSTKLSYLLDRLQQVRSCNVSPFSPWCINC
jgi:hypothetical protein